jgi:hypothetical protein
MQPIPIQRLSGRRRTLTMPFIGARNGTRRNGASNEFHAF